MTEPNYFYYLNQSQTYDIDGINDVTEFAEMKVSIKFVSKRHFNGRNPCRFAALVNRTRQIY
jgi:hypothetical protein